MRHMHTCGHKDGSGFHKDDAITCKVAFLISYMFKDLKFSVWK